MSPYSAAAGQMYYYKDTTDNGERKMDEKIGKIARASVYNICTSNRYDIHVYTQAVHCV